MDLEDNCMNAYYNNSKRRNSNNDIFERYFRGEAILPAHKRFADRLLSLLSSLLTILTGSVARRLLRVATVALLLVGMIGIIGAMEGGAVTLGFGFTVGVILLLLEFFCLHKQ